MSNIDGRILYNTSYDGSGLSNENTLNRALLTKPDKINPVITHLAGREDKRFPLSFLTEGQKGGVKPIELNSIEYEWDTFSRSKVSDVIVSSTYGASDKAGLNFQPFYVVFKTNWLKNQHLVEWGDGSVARIQARPKRVANGYQYMFRLTGSATAASYVNPAKLAAGTRWGMVGGAPNAQSLSYGNESNVMAPGKMKNQISILRKSYHIGGNIANKMVGVEFKLGNKTTRRWMDFEHWNHILQWKQVCEEHYWYSQYNRQADGTIPLVDEETGLPISIGGGVLDQIPNTDTYSELTLNKLKRTVTDVMYGATDTQKMDVVLFTGEGGAEEFDNAIKNAASGWNIVAGSDVGSKFVTGAPGSYDLAYGAYFTMYRHVDGHTITVKKVPLFDQGGRAEVSPKHPVSGRPLESYRMVFLDMSTYDGVRNVQMVTEKGRSMITGVVPGMAPLTGPALDFAGNSNRIATDQDVSSIHFLSAKGICINRPTHCFMLEIDDSIGV